MITPTALTPPWTSRPVTSMVDAAPTAMLVPVAAPRTGLTSVGELANTRAPDPARQLQQKQGWLRTWCS